MEDDRNWDERREYRRRRRVRSQIMAYAVVGIFLVAMAAGAVFGIGVISDRIKEKKQAEELARQLEEMSQEEEAIVGTPVSMEGTAAEEAAEETDWLEELVAATIEEMPLEDKVAGLFMITPEALTGVGQAIQAGEGTSQALEKYAVGGLIYFGQNIQSREQLTEMLANTRSMSKYPLFLAVDEEGGKIRRVGGSSIEVPEVGDMWNIGESGDSAQAYEAGSTLGSYLYELGFDVDFAPVADLVADPDGSVVGRRAFGGDPALVGEMAAAAADGIQAAGVSACLKHFPGIGAAAEDTHEGMVVLEKSAEELKASELAAFQPGIAGGVHLVMVGHVSVPAVAGDNTPASLSEEMITGLLRGELGYTGIVITDAMNMAAITEYYSSGDAAVMALKAGADMILMPEDFREAYEGVLAAVKEGVIAEERVNESLKRIYRVKYRNSLEE
ncbi:MAG: glycoside hydrolase family 3 protein [Kineothrix sp.]